MPMATRGQISRGLLISVCLGTVKPLLQSLLHQK